MSDVYDTADIGLNIVEVNTAPATVIPRNDSNEVMADNSKSHSREQSTGGGSGVDSSLIRPKRRVVKNTTAAGLNRAVERNYAVVSSVMFTNFTELKNDMISPEYAQEVLEKFMFECGIDMANSSATKMTEDIVFTFYIQNAASQKTGHEKVIDVYGVELDMMVMLRILVSEGITPRRFTRAMADRMFTFLRAPENAGLRADLVGKYSLEDPDHAVLAFDGSTHVTNMTTDRKGVANMLASRGIYENAASVKNASERTTYDGMLNNSRVHSGVLHNNGAT